MKMKRIISILTAALVAVSMMPAVALADDQINTASDSSFASDELIVVYKDDATYTEQLEDETVDAIQGKTSDEVQEVADEATDEIQNESDVDVDSGEMIADSMGDDGAALYVKLEDGQNLDEAMENIEKQDNVAYVQPNYEYSLLSTSTNDTNMSKQYYLGSWSDKYGADVLDAWDEAKTEGSVTVATIDSGVDADHPDLKDNIIGSAYVKEAANSVEDTIGHGTMVAGIIGAVANNSQGIAGASYNAKLYPIRAFDDEGSASTSWLIMSIKHLDNLVEHNELKNLHVINISAGNYSGNIDTAYESAINEMYDEHDVVTVCAGGNGNGRNKAYTSANYPSDFKKAFSVTALDTDGTNAAWSDYNENKNISAPGVSIYSTSLNGSYGSGDGTSFAAPLVSGVMALLWAENPNLTVAQATKAVTETAKAVNTSKNDRGSNTGSAGAIDAAAAVNYVKEHYSDYQSNATNISKCYDKASLSYTSCTYSGSAKKPAVTISGLKSGTDYTVSYVNNVNVGTASVKIKGKDKYKGTISLDFTIKAASMSDFASNVKLSYTSCTYSGSAKKPTVTISGLKSGTDYTVSYSNNTNVGKAKVVITGRGNYTGTTTKTFTIKPVATKLTKLYRYTRAFKANWQQKSTQVSGYQLQYSMCSSFKNDKTVRMPSYKTVSKKITKLSKKKYYYVRVRTYKTVDGTRYYSSWSSKQKVKTK